MKKFNIPKILLIIGVFVFCALLYSPFKEFQPFGDIHDTIDYRVHVWWADQDFVDSRPTSMRYNLYNYLDRETIVKTISIPSDSYSGTFTNVPKYNSDGSLALYYVLTDSNDSVDYFDTYGKYSYYGFCIEFGSNVFEGDTTKKINIITQTGDTSYYTHYAASSSQNKDFYLNDLKNKRICVKARSRRLEIICDTAHMDIKNVYMVSYDDATFLSTASGSIVYPSGVEIKRESNGTIPNYDDNYRVVYTTEEYVDEPFPYSDEIEHYPNKLNFKFVQKWDEIDDKPQSVTYNIYNEKNQNEIVKTVTLTNDNVDPNDSNKWNGVFERIPLYNDDGTRARYIIKTNDLNEYVNNYSFESVNPRDYNGICVNFGNNVFNGDTTKKIGIVGNYYYYQYGGIYYKWKYILNKNLNDNSIEFGYDDLSNKTVCIPITADREYFFIDGDTSNLDIKRIYPTYYDEFGSSESLEKYVYSDTLASIGDTIEYRGANYPNINSDATIKYYWDNAVTINSSFPYANTIVSSNRYQDISFEKYWEDEENTSLRPTSSEFYLYDRNDMNHIISTVTLTSSNADSSNQNKWNGEFTNVPTFDDNGNRIQYAVREKEIEYYQHFYDSKDGLIFTFNQKNYVYYNSTIVFIKDNKTGDWYKYAYDGSRETIGIGLPGDMVFSFKDAVHMKKQDQEINEETLRNMYSDSYFYSSSYNGFIEKVGNDYPETVHPLPYWDYYNWHYESSPTNQAQEVYILYHGESWGFQYGIKIDNIRPYGNETVITSKLNVKAIKVTKKWEDAGYESIRPNEVKLKIYDSENLTNLVRDEYISNADSIDDNTWEKNITNLPKYDSDGNEIKYYVKEEDNNQYFVVYDKDSEYYNGLSIKFSDDSDMPLILLLKDENNSIAPQISNYLDDTRCGYQTGGYEKDRVINFPYKEFYLIIDKNKFSSECPYSNEMHAKIVSIKPIHTRDTIDASSLYYYNSQIMHHHSYNDYFDSTGYVSDRNSTLDIYHYQWKGSLTPLEDDVTITNRINYKSIDITKEWNGATTEEERNQLVVDIYNDRGSDNVIKTIYANEFTIVDDNNWSLKVDNLRKYYDDGNEIQYIIKERPHEVYVPYYNKKTHNGFCVEINENVKNNDYIYFALKKENAFRAITVAKDITDYWIYPHDMEEKKICFKTDLNDFYMLMYNSSSDEKLTMISKIYPVYQDDFNYVVIDYSPSIIINELIELKGDEYKTHELTERSHNYIHYIWDDSKEPFNGNDIVINDSKRFNYSFTKKWNDIGYESYRPNSVTFNLYNELDNDNIVSSITLTAENVNLLNLYEWNGTFKDVPKYNSDGSESTYIVKEETTNNYSTKYDISEKNGYCIKFDKSIDNWGTSGYIYFLVKIDNVYRWVNPKDKLSGWYYYTKNNIDNYEVCFQTDSDDFYAYFYNSSRNQFIEKIYPVYMDEYKYVVGTTTTGVSGYSEFVITDDEYKLLSNESGGYIHYTWNGSSYSFKNAEIINSINKTNVEFTKIFEDNGYEELRPSRIKFDLYNIRNEENSVASIYLTMDNANPNNSYEWNGIFENVPKYNEDGSEVEYVVKEEDLDKYRTEYKTNVFNGYCVLFNDNINNWGDNTYIKFLIKEGDRFRQITSISELGNYKDFYKKYLFNKEVCFQTNSDDFYIYYERPTNEPVIDKIYPVFKDSFHYVPNSYLSTYNGTTWYPISGDDYKTKFPYNSSYYYHYTYKPTNSSFPNANIINHTNIREDTYIKEFNDEGYEYNRPNEIVFGLYLDNDPIPKEMTTLDTSTCENNTCTIEFKYVKDKDDNGDPIEYEIREISDYGYTVTYEDNKVINTANPVGVKFIKEDINGKPLRGAKLAIYNKSGDKLKEFTSSNREITIKLLPSEYTIKEIEPPDGYERINDIHIVVNEDGTYTQDGNAVETIRIVNEPIKEKYNINLKKTLKSNEDKEFEFEISIVDFDGTLEYNGDKNGTLTFANNKATIKLGGNEEVTIKDIPVNSKYEIRELTQDYLLTIVGDNVGTLNRNESIEFINVPYEQRGDGDIVIPEEEDVPTPITGILNIASYIAGVLLLIGSIFLIVYSKKQINKKEI